MTVGFEDKTIVCNDCRAPFLFSAGEQGFYAERRLRHEPKRCQDCRRKRRHDQQRERTIICAECGKEDVAPFVPRQGKPVLCGDCYRK